MPQGQLTPAQRANSAKGINAYWARFTPEQRSAEMKRRFAVARKKLLAESKEDPIQPKHDQATRDRWRRYKLKSRTARASTESPFPEEVTSKSTTRTTIRERLLAIENAVAALKADLGL
jgi:hypothetical protein